jgi:hypothetical protein
MVAMQSSKIESGGTTMPAFPYCSGTARRIFLLLPYASDGQTSHSLKTQTYLPAIRSTTGTLIN